jgi:hypothetical protein
MRKDAFCVMFLCVYLSVTFSCTTAQSQLSNNDFETISWDFKDGDGSVLSTFSLLKLIRTNTAEQRTLNVYLNDLLYNGKTAEAYLDDIKIASAEWEREYHGQIFTWEVKGKMLFIKREYYGGAGSSYQDITFYIIDTQSLKLLTIDDIFVNANSQEFKQIILNHLSRHENYDLISGSEENQGYLEETLEKKAYGIFYDRQGIVFHWDKGAIAANFAGGFDIIIPWVEIESYLTPTGKELMR